MNPKKFRAAVVGGTGYGGAELIRLILGHPHVALCRVSSIDHVGEPLEAVHLSLRDTGLKFEELPFQDAAKGMDVVFLGLPHKVSASLTPEIEKVDAAVIDLSGDFRLRDQDAYKKYYGATHPYPEQLDGRWIFGLPEMYRAEIKTARRVASPGCFATAIMLGLLPIARAGLLCGAIQTVGCTGSSGSGAYANAGTHHPLRAGNMKIYKPLQHQHTPEIERVLKEALALSGKNNPFKLNFVPLSAPLPRGILATSFVTLPDAITIDTIDRLYHDFYESSPLVHTLGSRGRSPEVVAVKGSMWVEMSWAMAEASGGTRQLIVTTALDNLVKGGAGQAIQSMNLLFGLPEETGINAPALWP